MKTVKLNNDVEMPIEGYGVYQLSLEETERCVTEALEAGYRSIDTAAAYMNETAVGKAIEKSGIPREELFVTTKLWLQDQGYDNTIKAFEASLANLGLDYIDLYLIHQPLGDVYGSWRALEDLYKQGKVRAIGVSNMEAGQMVDLILNSEIKPMVNQMEVHPFFQQIETKKVLDEYDVRMEAWGPLAQGRNKIYENETLQKIADKYKKTIAQVILRWHIERGIIVIPKSTHKERMQENLDIYDFSLTNEDLDLIEAMDSGKSDIVNYHSVEMVKMINSAKIHD